MIFLPIVERELRGAARRRATYGVRVKIGAGAVLALAGCYVASIGDPTFHFGQMLFWGLSGLCMVYCLAAGRIMTADCLSWEKREGTLGLLFLTDLKGYDVVVGKLAASSLDGFYGMLTVFPILAIPLLAGGLTRGEFWRMTLVLIDAFLFSLSVGLCASALNRDEQRAKAANLALLLWLAMVPPLIGGVLQLYIPGFAAGQQLFYTCPVYAFYQSQDRQYRASPKDFWWCIGINFLLTVLLLLFACRVTPRSWQDKAASGSRGKGGRRRRWWRDGNLQWESAFRKRLLDQNAYLWLAARPPLRAAFVWVLTGALAAFCSANILRVRGMAVDLGWEAFLGFAVLLNVMVKLWITAESSRQLAADKKSGAFELLLSTPLTISEILRGQALALRRQFLKPVALAAIVEIAGAVLIERLDTADRCVLLTGIVMFVIDAMALAWVGMLAGLTSRSHGRATVKTAACVLALPWVIWGAVELLMHIFGFLFVRSYWRPNQWVGLGCWLGVGILVDVVLICRARRALSTNFRRLAFEPPAPRRWFAWVRDWRTGTPERKAELGTRLRKVTLTTASICGAGAAAALYDIHVARANLPAPVVISMSHSNGPVRVVSSRPRFFFVLPDGSLWKWGDDKSASAPHRAGIDGQWSQVSIGATSLGLRSDGTLWTWSNDADKLKQIGSDHDWAEARASFGLFVARKRDGTLWAWGKNSKNQLGHGPGPSRSEPVRVGTNHNWKAIGHVYNESAAALRSDGTLWTWGDVSWSKNSWSWASTNFPKPVQLCRETNWAGFFSDMPEYARNQAGETWRITPLMGPPGPAAQAASVCRLIRSNANSFTYGPLHATNWLFGHYEVRADGALWATPLSLQNWPSGDPLGPPRRVGRRSDWLSVWSSGQTMLGQTADGTIWIWGLDYGQASRWTQVFAERIAMVKQVIDTALGARSPMYGGSSDQYPEQIEPRPLMRLIFTNAARASER